MFVENKDLMYEKLGYLTLNTHIRIDNTVRKAQKKKENFERI